MAYRGLGRQVARVALGQGLDRKTDPKQVVPGRLLELENGVFTSPGSIRKRNGLTSWTREIEGGDAFDTGRALSTYLDQLLLFDGSRVLSRLEATQRWLDRGPASSVVTDTDQVVRNGFVQSEPDVAALRGVELYAYEDSRGGVRAAVVDGDTRVPILQDVSLDTEARSPRCLAFNDALFVAYGSGNALKARRVDPAAPSVMGEESVWLTDLEDNSPGFRWDAVPVGSRLFLAYGNTSGGTSVRYLDTDMTLSSEVTLSGSGGAVAAWTDDEQRVWVAHVSGSGLYGNVFQYSLVRVTTASVPIDLGLSGVSNVTGVTVSGSRADVYFEVSSSLGSHNRFVKVASFDPTAVVSVVTGSVTEASTSLSSSFAPVSGLDLRGVALLGLEDRTGVSGTPPFAAISAGFVPTASEVTYFAGRGFNTVRVPFLWERMQPHVTGALDPGYLAHYSGTVDRALSASLNVIVECGGGGQRLVSGTMRTIGDGHIRHSDFANLWTRVADRWKHDPRVIFSLMKEPNTIPSSGSVAANGTITWVTASNTAIAAIRATGATNLIAVPGHGYSTAYGWNSTWYGTANGVAMLGVTDSGNNWAARVSNYPDLNHVADDTADAVNATILSTRAADVVSWARANSKRVLFTEFAVREGDPLGEDVITDFTAFCEDNSDVVEGWSWSTAGPQYPQFAGAAQLRGANVAGGELHHSLMPAVSGTNHTWGTAADATYLASKGVNFVRLLFSWEPLQNSALGSLNSSYLAGLQSAVARFKAQGIKVCLAMHGASYDNFAAYYGTKLTSSTHRAWFSNLWFRLATFFAGDDDVSFDLTNEPPGDDFGMTTENWFAAAQVAIDAIRSTGASNTIFVNGNGFSHPGEWSGSPWYGTSNAVGALTLTDSADNLVFSVHGYPDADGSGGGGAIVDSGYYPTALDEVATWCRANGKRFHVGELGFKASDPLAAATWSNFIDWVDANSDVCLGYTWWVYRSSPFGTSDNEFRLQPTAGPTDTAQMNLIEDEFSSGGDGTGHGYSLEPDPIGDPNGVEPAQQAWLDPVLAEVETVHTVSHVISSGSGVSVVSTAGQPAVWMRSVGLATKAWVHGDTHLVGTVHDSTLQSTYFVHNADGNVVSKANGLVGGGLRRSMTLSHVPSVADETVRFAALQKGRLVSENGTFFTSVGVTSTQLGFDAPNTFLSTEAANNLHVVGGVLGNYDGVSFTEHGFHLFPENVSASLGPGSPGIGAGVRQYRVVYRYPDARGQVHRSAPSVPISVTVTGSTDVTIHSPTLRLTGKRDVQVEVYRTVNNGDLFHLVNPSSFLFSSSSVDTVSFTDRLTDAQLISREPLYTTGDVLEHDAPPSLKLVASFDNRLWLGGLEDPDLLWFSKLITLGEPVAFNAGVLTMRVDPRGGQITALRALDSNLVVFKERAIHVVFGGGPNNLGEGPSYGQSVVTVDVGCSNANTLVTTDKGIFFLSGKGIHLLDRSLTVQYVGAKVEGLLNDLTVTAAALVADQNHVRFVTAEGPCLVYDYLVNEWTTFTNHAGVDAEVWRDSFLLLRSDGRVAEEDPTSFSDDGRQVSLKLTTSWLSFSGLAGFQRVRMLHVLGEYVGAHRLRVRLGYDYNPSFSEEAVIDAEAVMDLSAFGEDSPYGAGSPYGGEHPLYMFTVGVGHGHQKHRAMRVSLEDVQTGDFNEGLSLSALAFEVGVTPGGPQLRPRRRTGAR